MESKNTIKTRYSDTELLEFKELITDKMVQKLIRLLNFKKLTKDNSMTERQATALAEEIQEKWWAENKDWFLKDVEI